MSETCRKCGQEHAPRRCSGHKKRHSPEEPLEPCGNWKALGTDVCRMHGAKSLRGPAHPNFETGKFSDVLPAGWRSSAERLQKDPALLELREHIALVDTMIREELRKLGELDRPDVGARAAVRALAALDRATAARDGAAAQAAYSRLKDAIGQVQTQDRARHELHLLLEQRRRLVETEHRRIERMKAFVTTEQLTVLAYRFVDLGAEMMDALATQVSRLVDERRGQVREAVLTELSALGVGISKDLLEAAVQRAVEQLAIAPEIKAVSSRSLSDFAARLHEIGEAEGASDVEPDELTN